MGTNKNKLISVKIKGGYAKFFLLSLFFLYIGFHSLLTAQSIEIWPVEISFNYETGNSNDAITIRTNASTPITVPEYKKGIRNDACAYIKSQSNRKIKVKFNSNTSNMNFLVKATVISGTGIGNVCEGFVGACDINTNEVTLYLSGALPTTLGKRTFDWKWEATALPLNDPYCPIECVPCTTEEHTYYTLLATPQTPVEEPWTDVLDLACTWASNKTSEAQVVSDITTNAYNYFEQIKSYSGSGTHAGGTTFNLTGFFNANWGDCQDMSAVVQVFTWMLGGSVTRVRTINNKNLYVEDFYYQSIKPFGKGWTGIDWWNFHQVGWYNNVYDACIKVKYSNPRIPVNEDINGSYKTDLYYSGSWEPKTPFYFTTVY